MAFILFGGVIACNLFCVMTKRKNNIIALLSVVALSLVMAFAGTNFGDLESYFQRYNDLNFEFTVFEPGYIELNYFFNELGFSFDQFRLAIFIICSALLFFSVRRVTKNYNMVVLLYTLTMFYFLAVALRFFIAFSIAVFALTLLWKSKKRYVIISILLIVLAAQIHKSVYITLFFLIMVFSTKVLKMINNILTFISMASLIFAFILMLYPELIPTVANATNYILGGLFGDSLGDLLDSYLTRGYSRRYIIYCLFYAYSYIVSIMAIKSLRKHDRISDELSEKYKVVATLSLAMGFLVVVSQTFLRLMFIPLFMGFIMFAKVAESDKNDPVGVTINDSLISLELRNSLIISTSLTWFIMLYVVGDLSFNLVQFLSANAL